MKRRLDFKWESTLSTVLRFMATCMRMTLAFSAVAFLVVGFCRQNSPAIAASSQLASRQFQQLMDAGKFEAALALARQVVAKNPRLLKAHQQLYLAYHLAGRRYDALAESQTLLKLSGYADWALYDQALALEQAGMDALALKTYEQLLKHKPKDFNARLGKGQCLLGLGQNKESVEVFEQLTREKPNNVDAWANLAKAYLDYRDAIGAEIAAERVLKLQAKGSQAIRAARILSDARLNHMDFAGALSAGKQLLELDPKQPDAYVFVARLSLKYDDNPDHFAKLLYQAAANLPGQKEPFSLLASIFDQCSVVADGKRQGQTARRWRQLASYGWQLAAQGCEKASGKVHAWQMASYDQPDWVTARLGLAYDLIKMNEYGLAIKQAQMVLKIDPGNQKAKEINAYCVHARHALDNDLAEQLRQWLHGK